MNTFLTDVKHSMRMLAKSPGFTVTAVAALALGIGATTAVFSIVNTVLLKPLPVRDSDRLVLLATTVISETGESGTGTGASPAKFAHWRTQTSVLEDVSAYWPSVVSYTGGTTVEQWRSLTMSAGTFRCWGVPILKGRGFTADEDRPNGPRVALISANLWRRRFASDPQILGKLVSLNGAQHTVVGVVIDKPAGRQFDWSTDVYLPFQLDPFTNDQGDYFEVSARLKPGVTMEQARERLRASAGEFRAKFPNALGPKDGFSVKTYRDAMVGEVRPLLLVSRCRTTLTSTSRSPGGPGWTVARRRAG